MIRKLKSYWTFTGTVYKLILCVLIPVIVIGFGAFIGRELVFPAELFIMEMLPMIEVVADYWVFGGITSKKTERLEYLKTSKHGIRLLKDAVIGDTICILLQQFIITLAVHILTGPAAWEKSSNKTIMIVLSFCVAFFFTMLGITVSRFFTLLQINWLIAYAASMATAIMALFGMKCPYVACGIFFLLGIGISIGSVFLVMKRTKESYYDKAD